MDIEKKAIWPLAAMHSSLVQKENIPVLADSIDTVPGVQIINTAYVDILCKIHVALAAEVKSQHDTASVKIEEFVKDNKDLCPNRYKILKHQEDEIKRKQYELQLQENAGQQQQKELQQQQDEIQQEKYELQRKKYELQRKKYELQRKQDELQRKQDEKQIQSQPIVGTGNRMSREKPTQSHGDLIQYIDQKLVQKNQKDTVMFLDSFFQALNKHQATSLDNLFDFEDNTYHITYIFIKILQSQYVDLYDSCKKDLQQHKSSNKQTEEEKNSKQKIKKNVKFSDGD